MIIIDLSRNIIKRYVAVASPEKVTSSSNTVNGTVVTEGDVLYVQIDGSNVLTPVSSTIDLKDGDRVLVLLQNHQATVIGSPTSPTARLEELRALETGVSEFEVILADKVGTGELVAMQALIDELEAKDVEITGKLTANEASIDALEAENATINGKLDVYQADIEELQAETAKIETLEADNVTINEKLTAVEGDISTLEADNVTINNTLDAYKADITNLQAETAKIETLEADNATINEKLTAAEADISILKVGYGNIDVLESDLASFKTAVAEDFAADQAAIDELEANMLTAESADIRYANIDFSNIGDAAIETFFSKSGIIEDLVVSEGTITGELVGVTIKGDLIEGGTVVADKLVVKGENGLYYKLNTDGVTTEAEQTEYNSLSGSVITAKSITATKISVDDLVAFDATIGGFNITENSIYSGVKESVDNTTSGIYLDNTGQVAFGDASSYIKYFYDEATDTWKLAISADSISIGSSKKTVEEYVEEKAVEAATTAAAEAATPVLRIDSSRGTVFKNNAVATVLTVTIHRAGDKITNTTELQAIFGASAYLQWYWQRLDEETFGVISSTDSRISDGGFSLTLTPDDVDTKVTFMCELITD